MQTFRHPVRWVLLWRFFVAILLLLLPLPALAAQEGTPPPSPAPPSVITIRVWWPDALSTTEDDDAEEVLNTQFAGFNSTNQQYNVEVRLKPVEGAGSLFNTIEAAVPVAPDSVPDLILLRRDDLERAVQSGIIRSIDAWVPDSIRDQLLPDTLRLGEVNDVLYGLPYALDLSHILYSSDAFSRPPTTFSRVLQAEERFLLPGLPNSDQQVSDVLLAQYIRAGGNLADVEGNPTLIPEALQRVLNYYAAGLAAGVFTAEISTFDSEGDYLGRFLQGEVPLGVVSSSTYLQQRDKLADSLPAPIPAAQDERPITLLDGWMWVLVTPNPDHQNGALAFLEWMMRPDQQAAYTEALGVIPSQRSALRIWEDESYAELVLEWIGDSLIIPRERQANAAATQLQAAFISVLNGTPAEEAAATALANLQP